MIRPLASLGVSGLLHAALALVALGLVRPAAPQAPLFLDLTEPPPAESTAARETPRASPRPALDAAHGAVLGVAAHPRTLASTPPAVRDEDSGEHDPARPSVPGADGASLPVPGPSPAASPSATVATPPAPGVSLLAPAAPAPSVASSPTPSAVPPPSTVAPPAPATVPSPATVASPPPAVPPPAPAAAVAAPLAPPIGSPAPGVSSSARSASASVPAASLPARVASPPAPPVPPQPPPAQLAQRQAPSSAVAANAISPAESRASGSRDVPASASARLPDVAPPGSTAGERRAGGSLDGSPGPVSAADRMAPAAAPRASIVAAGHGTTTHASAASGSQGGSSRVDAVGPRSASNRDTQLEGRTDAASGVDGAPGSASVSGHGAATGAETQGSGDLALAVPRPGNGDGAEYGAYLRGLRALIQESVRYPAPARRRGLTGTVHLELLIGPDGGVRDVAVVRSSSHPVLDQAAVDSVRSLRPLPFPAGVARRALRVRVPVVFELQ